MERLPFITSFDPLYAEPDIQRQTGAYFMLVGLVRGVIVRRFSHERYISFSGPSHQIPAVGKVFPGDVLANFKTESQEQINFQGINEIPIAVATICAPSFTVHYASVYDGLGPRAVRWDLPPIEYGRVNELTPLRIAAAVAGAVEARGMEVAENKNGLPVYPQELAGLAAYVNDGEYAYPL